jgi:hypothetical protein
VADPLRHFVDGVLSLTNPIGSVGDKVNVGLFRCGCWAVCLALTARCDSAAGDSASSRVLTHATAAAAACRLKTLLGPLDAIYQRPETTTLERLRVRAEPLLCPAATEVVCCV